MKRSTAFLISLVLVGVGLVVVDNLTNWDTWVKVAVAVVAALVPLYFIRTPQPTPSTPATTTPATKKPDGSERVLTWTLTLMFTALVIYGVIFWLIMPLYNMTQREIANLPGPTVVENGFPRHDAPYPTQKIIPPFVKSLEAGKTYSVFKLKAGDIYKVNNLSAPIQLRINNPAITGFDLITKPTRLRAKFDGTLTIVSPTGGNQVLVTRQ